MARYFYVVEIETKAGLELKRNGIVTYTDLDVIAKNIETPIRSVQ